MVPRVLVPVFALALVAGTGLAAAAEPDRRAEVELAGPADRAALEEGRAKLLPRGVDERAARIPLPVAGEDRGSRSGLLPQHDPHPVAPTAPSAVARWALAHATTTAFG